MDVRLLADENSVFKGAYARLLELIREAEERFDEKLYVDTMTGSGKTWLNVNVFLHGDRNVINWVIIKMVTWQNRNIPSWQSKLYVYPAEEKSEKYNYG